MATRKTRRKTASARRSDAKQDEAPVRLLGDHDHPDYLPGTVGEGPQDAEAFTPVPGGPLPPFPPGPLPPGPFPPGPFPPIEPRPVPIPPHVPIPWPLTRCGPVSGRYTYEATPVPMRPPLVPPLPVQPVPRPLLLPLGLLRVTVRVDVDRYFPQNRISIEVTRLFPRATAHAIAEVTSDACLALNRRRITAEITYRDGDPNLIRGDQVVFEATRDRGIAYASYRLTLSGGGVSARTYDLTFRSRFFDPVEFEVDCVSNAGAAVTTVDTAAHPNRPADLPAEVISLTTVFERAGFEATLSPHGGVIPVTGAGANGTWSDAEMHDAMVQYWSRFADRPQWAMWVLFAARHDMGRGLGGIMFDDIGPNHRQGTAIFTDSFIQDVPPGDPNAAAFRRRNVFWTAVHEVGHAFNLAHSWQKALGVPQGAPGDPWIPLANQPEARSFMNYPDRVAGGQAAFFGDFRYRFTDDELAFLRHAPRRFVQMGNANWFVNHGFEAPSRLLQSGRWGLYLRPNRDGNDFAFMEPVVLELKLKNESQHEARVDPHLLEDGRHITLFVQREGSDVRMWRPMMTRCHEASDAPLKAGASIYGAHLISASPEGWLIDEPGFYRVQAAVDLGGEVVISNVLRLHVAPPASADANALATDYFREDVGRALAFGGVPSAAAAMDTLRSVTERCPGTPAALHAAVAVSTPMLRDFKRLAPGDDRDELEIRADGADVEAAAKVQLDALLGDPHAAAATLGHIEYFEAVDDLAEALRSAGDGDAAKRVLQTSVQTMKARSILASVVTATERKLARIR